MCNGGAGPSDQCVEAEEGETEVSNWQLRIFRMKIHDRDSELVLPKGRPLVCNFDHREQEVVLACGKLAEA